MIVPSKIARRSSKIFDKEKEESIPIGYKALDNGKSSTERRISIAKLECRSELKNEIGGGFFVRKTMKSPSTPGSSDSHTFGGKFGSKKMLGLKPQGGIQKSIDKSADGFGLYGGRENRFGIPPTGSESRNLKFEENEHRKSTNYAPSVPISSSLLVGGARPGLGGGGLTRTNALSLGRHQM